MITDWTEIQIPERHFAILQKYSELTGKPVEQLIDAALSEYIEAEVDKKKA